VALLDEELSEINHRPKIKFAIHNIHNKKKLCMMFVVSVYPVKI
jgi:hypothetical protein